MTAEASRGTRLTPGWRTLRRTDRSSPLESGGRCERRRPGAAGLVETSSTRARSRPPSGGGGRGRRRPGRRPRPSIGSTGRRTRWWRDPGRRPGRRPRAGAEQSGSYAHRPRRPCRDRPPASVPICSTWFWVFSVALFIIVGTPSTGRFRGERHDQDRYRRGDDPGDLGSDPSPPCGRAGRGGRAGRVAGRAARGCLLSVCVLSVCAAVEVGAVVRSGRCRCGCWCVLMRRSPVRGPTRGNGQEESPSTSVAGDGDPRSWPRLDPLHQLAVGFGPDRLGLRRDQLPGSAASRCSDSTDTSRRTAPVSDRSAHSDRASASPGARCPDAEEPPVAGPRRAPRPRRAIRASADGNDDPASIRIPSCSATTGSSTCRTWDRWRVRFEIRCSSSSTHRSGDRPR